MYNETQPSDDGRRFERERGFAYDNRAAHEARLAGSAMWLAGGGIDSRGALPVEGGLGAAPASGSASDARLWRAVRFALLMDGYSAVEVTVVDGHVTLHGSVADIPTRVMAEDCCMRLPEVREVANRIRVRADAPRERAVGE